MHYYLIIIKKEFRKCSFVNENRPYFVSYREIDEEEYENLYIMKADFNLRWGKI